LQDGLARDARGTAPRPRQVEHTARAADLGIAPGEIVRADAI
jgi:hypothetical protein